MQESTLHGKVKQEGKRENKLEGQGAYGRNIQEGRWKKLDARRARKKPKC